MGVKVMAFSDVHGRDITQFEPKGADVCVIAGDIAPINGFTHWDIQRQEQWVKVVFCGYMAKHKKTEFVFVAGNHDFWGERVSPSDPVWPTNAHYLRNSECTVKGLRFFGVPQVPYIGASRRWAFESSPHALEAAFSQVPNGVDVLVTHTPPKVAGSNIDSSGVDIYTGEITHFGSDELHDALIVKRPRFLFCGHIHTGDHRKTKVCDTQCFNVSVVDEQYNVAYKPLRVEIL